MIKILLSKKLGELRMTQMDLSRKTGIRPGTINVYYNDLTPHVNLEYIDLICQVLGCDVSEIIVSIPNNPPKPPHTPKKRRGRNAK